MAVRKSAMLLRWVMWLHSSSSKTPRAIIMPPALVLGIEGSLPKWRTVLRLEVLWMNWEKMFIGLKMNHWIWCSLYHPLSNTCIGYWPKMPSKCSAGTLKFHVEWTEEWGSSLTSSYVTPRILSLIITQSALEPLRPDDPKYWADKCEKPRNYK